MTVEMTAYEAEILIACLTGAEASFAMTNPPLVEALQALRPWRSSLVRAYLQDRVEAMRSADAVGLSVESPIASTRD